MTPSTLDKIFQPRSVAIVGASDSPGKVGAIVLQNLVAAGFPGPIYPVNARQATVQGRTAFRRVGDLPAPPDLAIVCTPAATVADVVGECGEAGVGGMIILSAGFREMGEEGRRQEERVAEARRRHPQMRIIGPNCLGVLAPAARLNASFAAGMPAAGRVAFLSQSGALCTAVLDWARGERLGFSHFVSLGNMLDVGLGDLLDYLARDPGTDAAILYVESIQDARSFMSAARAFAREKPIVAYKAGRFAESAKAAASHTGAMAGVDAVYEAAFQRAGIVRVFAMDEMFECAELLARRRPPAGSRLAIVTNAGGPGVMATDALLEQRGELATLAPETLARLDACLPRSWSHGNPVDVLGDAPPERYVEALRIVAADPGVDATLAVLTPQAMTDPSATATAVAAAAKESPKLLLAAWMGGESVRAGIDTLNRADVPTFGTPEQAVNAFMKLVGYARNRDVLYETPRELPIAFTPAQEAERRRVHELLARGASTTLAEHDSKTLLEAYGIPTTRPCPAETVDAAVRAARELGYPVVLKLLSPQITHKTDVGGVALNLASDAAVREAFQTIVATAAQRRPDATIQGVTVQRMVTAVNGVELILGARQDPVFGAVIMVGMGGVAAELYRDRALELPPLNERLARRMLQSLRTWPLLAGYRGRPPMNVDRLVEQLIRFSYLLAECPEIQECDINPLLVTPGDVVALDARVVVNAGRPADPRRPFSHLAIRPYPDGLERETQTRDGQTLLLRPIKPEDIPLWQQMVRRCSVDTLRARFRFQFPTPSHETAARFCFVDYDREMAIVAQRGEGDERELIGLSRLVADLDHQSAEFAVIVIDEWQGRGVGGRLTEQALEVARRWGVSRVFAETTPDNARMLATFRRAGFRMSFQSDEKTVRVEKTL